MLPLISFQGYHQDLNHQNYEFLVQSLSPQSVIKFAILADEIDWRDLKDAYYDLCQDSTKESLTSYGYSQADSNRSFEKGFVPYIARRMG